MLAADHPWRPAWSRRANTIAREFPPGHIGGSGNRAAGLACPRSLFQCPFAAASKLRGPDSTKCTVFRISSSGQQPPPHGHHRAGTATAQAPACLVRSSETRRRAGCIVASGQEARELGLAERDGGRVPTAMAAAIGCDARRRTARPPRAAAVIGGGPSLPRLWSGRLRQMPARDGLQQRPRGHLGAVSAGP
jgi:hypothetical protein